jgi:hypothetical protein
MAKRIPDSTEDLLHLHLVQRARARWPDLADVRMRYRVGFAYVDGVIVDGPGMPLCLLRCLASATPWSFAIHRPAMTITRTTSCPAAHPPAPPKRPSTAPAASTSTTRPSGRSRIHRRTSRQGH